MYKFLNNDFRRSFFFTVSAILIFLCGCGGNRGSDQPLEKIKVSLKNAPDYSIILEDMKQEGNFIPGYFHKYRVIQGDQQNKTGWMKVSEKNYRLNESFLGMTLVAKKDGEAISGAAPPGYQYVGDQRYGRWQNDHRGGTFWEFYGKYALFSALLGGIHRPIYRSNYDFYKQSQRRNVPYFGRNNEYGTNGSFTKKNRPDFYSRYSKREQMKKTSFKDKVTKRVGRTRTGYRSRAGGFGK